MIKPFELSSERPMLIAHRRMSITTLVWQILEASYKGDLDKVNRLTTECPELSYAQYNYTPPIHFAVREGHHALVNYLLEKGALDPDYINYPFKDNLLILAADRGHEEIAGSLKKYLADPTRCRYKGDNGEINYNRTALQQEFEDAVDKEDLQKVEKLLQQDPSMATDQSFFWSEGILMMPAKKGNHSLIELLMSYGAKVPEVLKWTQFYYFEREDTPAFLLEKGMNANTMNWNRVTILHDMAQKGNIAKAELLIRFGANINAIDEEYQSTALGLAARWGQEEMVAFLLDKGADPNLSGASWSKPLAWAKKKNYSSVEALLQEAGAK